MFIIPFSDLRLMLSLPFLKDLYEVFFKSTIRLGVKDIFSLEKIIEGMLTRKKQINKDTLQQ